MKTTCILISALLLSITSFSQSTKLLNTTQNECIAEHLKALQAIRFDTSYHQSLTSIEPIICDEKTLNFVQNFPYPIIFIHGLRGCADSWIEFYNNALNQGWSYGGHLKYNLNSDQNFGNSTLNDVHDFNVQLQSADFYLLNFNVTVNGISQGSSPSSDATLSNQSAIVKQGYALGKAIKKVLQATGKDRVILVGHSMGGLCAREYLQNPSNWQSDGQHHIAKLVTLGTPHGGSNMSGTFLGQIFTNIDESSEAIRDL
ncbi:MAG: alpha/beta fold hydrolase, partial [Cyclobacteriaceae bacterium]